MIKFKARITINKMLSLKLQALTERMSYKSYLRA